MCTGLAGAPHESLLLMEPLMFTSRARIVLVVIMAVATYGAIPAAASPDPDVSVTIIDAYGPAVGVAVAVTVCIDNGKFTELATAVKGGPFKVSPGHHAIDVYLGAGGCTGTQVIHATIDVPTAKAATIMLGTDAQGGTASVFADNTDCLSPETTRVVLRNGADLTALGGIAGLQGILPGSSVASPVTDSVGFGQQSTRTVPAHDFTNTAVVAGGTVLQHFGDATFAPGFETQYYVYGGTEGAAGAFSFDFPVTLCQTPATTLAPGAQPTVPVVTGKTKQPGGDSEPHSTKRISPVARAMPAMAIQATVEPTYTG